ncbi:formyltetrahydrofolate deformylase [Aestuariibacter sp. AA17]|uniref:Formyltetrahydrofolate deformylase n=1 Tax=Fluctibacter corallii TaxID=2984329 RepID=A0ABT3A6S3_9ALTE|nr:formyltetrahydrofolate deformylase [Aestuariibacter sp. AA17]MCV2884344.1 formyltetrahydrofolate deformylase [Aestuariibacter sp. AA17]
MQQTFKLVIDCPDQVGLVAAVSQFLAEHDATIVEASHHTDLQLGHFFMRHEINADSLALTKASFIDAFEPIAQQFSMNWHLTASAEKPKMAILASHESHCLIDLLHRWHTGELNCEIPCIIANHAHMEKFAEWYQVPFHFVDFKALGKNAAFKKVSELLAHYDADLTVLARFMQILPDWLCDELAGKAINIHHSFLPSFAGAKPYQQAYERGVKLIGATCHYVTQDLDEGPIIEQQVIRISHSDSAADMVRKGKDCEKTALANGVRYHLEDRVIIHQNKTVVFA